ncbi:MAG: TRAP transporter small permease subunit [Pseudomonadota bacterium]
MAGRALGQAVRIGRAAIRGWALLGGFLLCALAMMTAASALSNILFAAPLPADHELIKHGVAIIVFMLLPYCQLSGANVTVDIFTDGMGPRTKAAMAAFASLLALAFAALMLRQMSEGFESYLTYVEVTPVLKLPLWTAFPPILISLALLALAALITLGEGLRGAVRGEESAA